MFTVSCVAIEPELESEHFIKADDMEELKKNVRNHIKENHPEIEYSAEDMDKLEAKTEMKAEREDEDIEGALF